MPVMGDRNRKRWKRRKHWNGWLKRAVALRCHLFHHVTSTPTNHKAISKYRRFFANYWSFPVNFGQHFWMGFVCFFWVFFGLLFWVLVNHSNFSCSVFRCFRSIFWLSSNFGEFQVQFLDNSFLVFFG